MERIIHNGVKWWDIFLREKNMCGYISISLVKHKNTDKGYVVFIDMWESNNAKILLGLTIMLSLP